MPLTVLSIAYPYAPVGDRAVGGAEQILGDLDRALMRGGHRSLVVACEGSNPCGTLYAAPVPGGRLDEADRRWWRTRYQTAIDQALRSCRVDLIHCHGLDFDEYIFPAGIPVLVTLHMPLSWYANGALQRLGSNVILQCVSATQRASGPRELHSAPVVRNGVDLPAFAPPAKRGRYAVALGRICPEKNQHEALRVGARVGIPVHVGGQVFHYTAHQRYMEEVVRPELDRFPAHRMLGVIPAWQRHALLSGARCLLHPTRAPETSSLVAMEALAAGTPVIAYRSGALPEIVDDGITGFLVDDLQGMIAAIRRVEVIRAEDCRAAAEARFGKEQMLQAYFRLYETMLRGGDLRYA